ncbi:MAG: zinc ribbon domain-containing protein [Elusimicrobia bacterium]|nr:zinc ribbon domain-containing protein [Elusimicrobiota bacterium]
MNCPKCRNPVDDQASFCGVCSEILRKEPPAAAPPAVAERVEAVARGWTPRVIAVALALFAMLVPFRARVMNALWFLDFVNLAFHEGGHIVFGLLGNRFIMVCGGTAMQLLLPAAAAWHFYRRGERASASGALWWFGQNFLGIGRYVADARAQRLDLVAGGVHDWTYLLETVGLLIHDEGIGRAVQILGCLIMAFSAAGVYVYWREKRRTSA